MNNLVLATIALLPAVVLCTYVYVKDRVEKEPTKLLLKLFTFGAILCFPAMVIENVIEEGILHNIFSFETVLRAETGRNSIGAMFYVIALHFLCVAPAEEGLKFLLLNFMNRNKEYNCTFDGLIYAVFISLGFATLENVLYVLNYGMETAIVRAILSVPGHMFFAVLMGFYYSLWHIADRAKNVEERLRDEDVIGYKRPFNPKKYRVLSICMPILAHGFYNTSCSFGSTLAMLVNVVFVAFLYVHCFGNIRDMSRTDAYEDKYVRYLLEKKYPNLAGTDYTLESEEESDDIMDIIEEALE